MTTIKVPDMMCENCVKRITNALTTAGLAFQVSLADKTVSVEEASVAAAKEELEDLGFTPEVCGLIGSGPGATRGDPRLSKSLFDSLGQVFRTSKSSENL